MQKTLGIRLPATVLLLALSTVLLAADGPHDKAIKARQAMFQLYSFNIGVVSAMAKGDREYDADVAREAAENLRAAAHLGNPSFGLLDLTMPPMAMPEPVPYRQSGQPFQPLLKRRMR